VKEGFEILVANLHENIQVLNNDSNFQDSLETMHRNVQQKAATLEAEVKQLRSDIKTINDLLGDNDKK